MTLTVRNRAGHWRIAAAAAFAVWAGFSGGAARAEGDTIVAHGISTFGDLKYPAGFPHLDYVNPDAPKGGEIAEWAAGGFDSMNPYTAKGRAAALSAGMYESLMTTVADEIGSSYCLICETLEYPKDRSWVIFTLRPDVKFADGSPLTADDVVFSYGLLRDKGLPSFQAVIQTQVESAEVIDPLHVKFTFKTGIPTRDLPETAGGLPIFSRADYEKNNRNIEESSLEPFLGSGPYILDSMDVGQRVVYRRNPDYWGASHPLNIGRNNFDRIRIEYFGDYDAAFEGFKSGAYTFRNEASSLIWATRYDFPALQKGWVVKHELPDGSIANGQAFVMNLRREKFQDPRVREAIGLMFNFEWSNKTLFYGLYTRINSFWENSDLAATGLPSPEEMALLEPLKDKLPAGVLDQEPVTAPVSSDNQLDRSNVRKASKLLDEAGWVAGSDGMRRNDKGETLKVEFLSADPAFDRVVNPFIENLRKVGVDATLSRIDDSQYTDRTRSFDFDMITDNLPTGFEPSAGLRQYFGTEGLKDAFNTMGLSDPAVDALITDVLNAQSRDELKVSVHALDRVLRAIRFWIPQWYKNVNTVAYYDMYEHPANMPPFSLGNLDFWWYNAEKADKLKAAGAFR